MLKLVNMIYYHNIKRLSICEGRHMKTLIQDSIDKIIAENPQTNIELARAKRIHAKKFGVAIPANTEIIREYGNLVKNKKIKADLGFEKIVKRRSVRTLSGIAPVAVLTMPYSCPGKCAYCPAEKDVPQSYLSNEPAVMRAIRCGYDPYVQVHDRLRALIANGHKPEKIELIVIGGTWSVLPENYKYWFIARCFEAANKLKVESLKFKVNRNKNINKLKRTLAFEQKKNERAKYRIIGVTLETRPDYINNKEIAQMRELGCTRVELGVQAIDDKILKINKRGHGVEAIAGATKLLKDWGFKVTYHIMPGLPGSTPSKDLKMFKALFTDERFQPDQIKFYPTVVTKGSLLYKWWRAGKYKPYPEKSLRKLIIDCKKIVPEYVRIIRLIRDIPEESIVAGNRITNLRQVMQNEGIECRCIRCREIKDKSEIRNPKSEIISYSASGGVEYFIASESEDGKTLFGFCRLRLGEKEKDFGVIGDMGGIREIRGEEDNLPAVLKNAAIIRELHVYGELTEIGEMGKVQHIGIGKELMKEAEKLAKENNYDKIAVISGIGARNYYRKLGYRLKEGYMVKEVKTMIKG
jgi:elongator complex protein 3